MKKGKCHNNIYKNKILFEKPNAFQKTAKQKSYYKEKEKLNSRKWFDFDERLFLCITSACFISIFIVRFSLQYYFLSLNNLWTYIDIVVLSALLYLAFCTIETKLLIFFIIISAIFNSIPVWKYIFLNSKYIPSVLSHCFITPAILCVSLICSTIVMVIEGC